MAPFNHHGTPTPSRAVLDARLPPAVNSRHSVGRIGPWAAELTGKIPREPRPAGADAEGNAAGTRASLGDPRALLNPGVPARSGTAAGGRWPDAGHGRPGGEAQRQRGQRHQAGRPGSAGCRASAGSLFPGASSIGIALLRPAPGRAPNTPWLLCSLPKKVGSRFPQEPGSGNSLPASSLFPSQRSRRWT